MKKVLSSIFSFTLVLGLSLFGFNNASAQNDVTITVDVSAFAETFSTVFVAAAFNGWTDANPLTDMGSGIWSTVVSLPDGNHEYKFMVDNWAFQEELLQGTPGTTTNGCFTNRLAVVAGAPVDQGTVCWGTGNADCSFVPSAGDITFSVNVSELVSFTPPIYVAGPFNGWNPSEIALTDMGSGLWSATVPGIPGGATLFKFAESGNFEVPLAVDPCTAECDGFVNRTLFVDGNAVLPAVCWAECEDCGVVGTVNVFQNNELFTLQPTLVNQYTSLEFNLNTAEKEISVYNGMGQVFLTENVDQSVSSYEIYTSNFTNGVYFIKVQMENDIQIERIMVSH